MRLICSVKPRLFKIPKTSDHPIYTQYVYGESQYKKFHFHEEIQFTYVIKGKGMMIAGNSSITFEPKTLFVLGENLSHVFIGEDGCVVESVSIYVKKNWLTNIYPESNFLDYLIQKSKKGIKVSKVSFGNLIEDVLNQSGLNRIRYFLELLDKIGSATDKVSIAKLEGANVHLKNEDSGRLNEVFRYIIDNFREEIKLEDVAELANMAPQSFCRYFKQRTEKTLSQFIMELRINSACKMLQETDYSIEEIGYKCGYHSFSNFVKQFKKLQHGLTPKEFRNKHKQLITA